MADLGTAMAISHGSHPDSKLIPRNSIFTVFDANRKGELPFKVEKNVKSEDKIDIPKPQQLQDPEPHIIPQGGILAQLECDISEDNMIQTARDVFSISSSLKSGDIEMANYHAIKAAEHQPKPQLEPKTVRDSMKAAEKQATTIESLLKVIADSTQKTQKYFEEKDYEAKLDKVSSRMSNKVISDALPEVQDEEAIPEMERLNELEVKIDKMLEGDVSVDKLMDFVNATEGFKDIKRKSHKGKLQAAIAQRILDLIATEESKSRLTIEKPESKSTPTPLPSPPPSLQSIEDFTANLFPQSSPTPTPATGQGINLNSYSRPISMRSTFGDYHHIDNNCWVNTKKLQKDSALVLINGNSNKIYKDYRVHIISKELKRVIQYFIKTGTLRDDDIRELSEDDLKLLRFLLKKCKKSELLPDPPKPTPTPSAVTLGSTTVRQKTRLKNLMGSIDSGQNNPNLYSELHALAKRLNEKKALTDRDLADIQELYEL